MANLADSTEYFSTVDQECNIEVDVPAPKETAEAEENTHPDNAPVHRNRRRSLRQLLRDPNIQLKLALGGVPSLITLIIIVMVLLHTLNPGLVSSVADPDPADKKNTSCNNSINPCFEKDSGVQDISKKWGLLDSGQIRCDKDNGGPWLVFQLRDDGEGLNAFNKEFDEYVEGFGVLNGSGNTNGFWLGLSKISGLTNLCDAVLRIDLWVEAPCRPCPDEHYYVEYSTFKVSNITRGKGNPGFILTIGGYSGSGGDSMKDFNGNQFITKDIPSSVSGSDLARDTYFGGWWYGSEKPVSGGVLNAAFGNPPSKNLREKPKPSAIYLWWLKKGTSELVEFVPKKIEMKLKFRPSNK